jgi:hypothetical protein
LRGEVVDVSQSGEEVNPGNTMNVPSIVKIENMVLKAKSGRTGHGAWHMAKKRVSGKW